MWNVLGAPVSKLGGEEKPGGEEASVGPPIFNSLRPGCPATASSRSLDTAIICRFVPLRIYQFQLIEMFQMYIQCTFRKSQIQMVNSGCERLRGHLFTFWQKDVTHKRHFRFFKSIWCWIKATSSFIKPRSLLVASTWIYSSWLCPECDRGAVVIVLLLSRGTRTDEIGILQIFPPLVLWHGFQHAPSPSTFSTSLVPLPPRI